MQFALSWALAWLAVVASVASAQQTGWTQELLGIENAWVTANYETPEDSQNRAFEALSRRADAFAGAHPDRAEPLTWTGIVKTSWAGVSGAMQALQLANEARTALEAAERLDPAALGGSVYTTLGLLYTHVPGWPLAFGSRTKARAYFERALEVNPAGMDPNYFYGAFLADAGEVARAREHLERARAAASRPGHERAEARRRKEIEDQLAQLPES
jgi:tetratricopeptide (TPR) repeat protein